MLLVEQVLVFHYPHLLLVVVQAQVLAVCITVILLKHSMLTLLSTLFNRMLLQAVLV